jgi:hypothetical protein
MFRHPYLNRDIDSLDADMLKDAVVCKVFGSSKYALDFPSVTEFYYENYKDAKHDYDLIQQIVKKGVTMINRVYKLTLRHHDPIDLGIVETYEPKVKFQLGELQKDYTFESTLLSDDIELIYKALVEINRGNTADALLDMALANTEIITVVDYSQYPYEVAIEPVLDNMTRKKYEKIAEEHKCVLIWTGADNECIVKSQSLNSMYNFLREEYCGGDTEQALYHMTTLKGA